MHKRFNVTGRVQGVYFRASTQDKARSLGLQGWVCNKLNGDVLLQARGDAEALRRLEEWLWQGPKMAIVEDVQVAVLDDNTGLEYDGFIIKREQI